MFKILTPVILLVFLIISSARAGVTLTEDTVTFNATDYEKYMFPALPWETCYPYGKLDANNARRFAAKELVLKTLVLENEYLRLTILPGFGGRIYDAVYKPTSQALFFKQKNMRPAVLYWGGTGYINYIGGIKFGFPSFMHTPNNETPWQYKITKNDDKSISVLLYDTDLETDMKISETITLRPAAANIEIDTLLENPTPYKRRYCYWIVAPMEQNENVEFVFPTDRMILHTGGWGVSERTVLSWPVCGGVDYSYFKNWEKAQGLFPAKSKKEFVGSFDHGKKLGIVRIYPNDIVPGVKLWCEGRGSKSYEIFGGATETQEDYVFMEPGGSLKWKESWYPVYDTKGFIYANKDAALNLKKTAGNKLLVWLASPNDLDNLEVKVRINNDVKYENKIKITPAASFNAVLDAAEGNKISVTCVHNGREILKYETDMGKVKDE